MSLRRSRPVLPFDVLFHIVQCVDTEDCELLYALAQTCRALRDPALGKLWHTQDSLTPFLLLLPHRYRVLEKYFYTGPLLSMYEDLEDLLRSEGFPQRAQARMTSYAKRIRRLHGFSSWKYSAEPETTRFMFGTLPRLLGTDCLFPNLMELTLNDDEESSSVFGIDPLNPNNHRILTLLAPSLQFLNVSVGNDESLRYCAAPLVAEALRRCRKLHTLTIVSSKSLWDNHPSQRPVVIDLRTFFRTPEALEELASLAAHSSSLKDVAITTNWRMSCRTDLVATPFTVHVLGYFKSIRTLSLTLDDLDGTLKQAIPLGSPSSVFSELERLRLRVSSLATATWFFDSCASTKMEEIYIRLEVDLSLEGLTRFISSLEQFRSKLSHVTGLGIRATDLSNYPGNYDIVKQSHPLFQSLISAISRLFPRVRRLKLKLFPRFTHDWDIGFLHAPDIIIIGDAFPELEVLKVKVGVHDNNPTYISLRDVIHFAHRFPKIRELGVDLDHKADFYRHLQDKSTVVSSVESGLCVLRLYESSFPEATQEDIAAYLRKHLPRLRTVKICSYSDSCHRWETVGQLLNAT